LRLTLAYRTVDGDSRQVQTNLATLVKWERLYKRKISQIGDGIGAEDLAYFAYEATRQAGIVVPATLDQFIEQLENMPEIVEADDRNPTDPAASATS
jgi:hypothetical protein